MKSRTRQPVVRKSLTLASMRLMLEAGDATQNRPIAGGEGETIYPAPAEDFILSVIILRDGRTFMSRLNRSVEIMICMQGSGRIVDLAGGESTDFSRGTSWIIPAAVKQYRIEGEATIYIAAVPLYGPA